MTHSLITKSSCEGRRPDATMTDMTRNLAERYMKNWHEHAQHSEVYVGRER